MPPRLLILSNGHGEDLIALRVIGALHRLLPDLELQVLPLVGEGSSYRKAEALGMLRQVGPRQSLPSGGFSNQSLSGLLRDLGAGLPLLFARQIQLVRRWGERGDPILAVGDLLPLALAWASGSRFGFVGTPKSDFTWASAPPAGWGSSPLADGYHRCKGSEWDPWEWGLMASRRCHLVAVRDPLTARGLRRHRVAALAPGNPMMDGFDFSPRPAWLAGKQVVLLLAGSRHPEALGNFRRLLGALPHRPQQPLTVLTAVGSRPRPEELVAPLTEAGFAAIPLPAPDCAAAAWQRGDVTLLIGPARFEQWAGWADLGLAAAGTATEQLVGLGIPALSSPGPGPQFKAGFARRQSRLLGGAVQPCHDQTELTLRLQALLQDLTERQRLGRIGRRRMGPPGASERLAALIATRLLPEWGG